MKKSKRASFFVSRALCKIKKSMREERSKSATFAQNHNIWTHARLCVIVRFRFAKKIVPLELGNEIKCKWMFQK